MKYNAINIKYNQPQVKYNGAFVVSGFDYSNFTTTTTSFIEVISSGLMSFSVVNAAGVGTISFAASSDGDHVELSSNVIISRNSILEVELNEENSYSAEVKTINTSTMGTSS